VAVAGLKKEEPRQWPSLGGAPSRWWPLLGGAPPLGRAPSRWWPSGANPRLPSGGTVSPAHGGDALDPPRRGASAEVGEVGRGCSRAAAARAKGIARVATTADKCSSIKN
jgi:hypothetical protein